MAAAKANMSWNPPTMVCKQPPAPPEWYTPPPPYAPAYAPLECAATAADAMVGAAGPGME